MAHLKGTFLPALILYISLQGGLAAAHDTQDNGLWLSDGYGLLVEIRDGGLHTFQLAGISCISGWSAQRHTAPGNKKSVFIGNNAVHLFASPSADMKLLHLDGTASDIVLHRTSERPAKCAQQSDNSPQGNYAVFWQTFAEQYPFFSLHTIDWLSVDRRFRPQVGSETTQGELFEVLRQMIEPLQAAHTGIVAADGGFDCRTRSI